MVELEKYILENYLERIVSIDEEGRKYIKEKDFNDLSLNNDEKKFFLSIIKNNNIKIKKDKELIDDIEELEKDEKDFLENFVLPDSLTKEENLELLKKYRDTKDATLKEKLVLGNLGLVDKIAKQYIKSDEDSIDELRSYGYEGLLKAIDAFKFDSTRKKNFSSYAIKRIREFISRKRFELDGISYDSWSQLFYNCKSIVEQETNQTLKENLKLIDDINELMFEKCEEKIAKGQKAPITPSKKASLLRQQKHANLVKITIFFNEKIEDLYNYNEDTKNDSFIDYDSIMEVESKVLNDELGETLEKVMCILNEREKQIILLRYGFIDGKERTYREISKIMNLSHQRVREIDHTACFKLNRTRYCKLNNLKELKSFLPAKNENNFNRFRNLSSSSQQKFETHNYTSNEQQLRNTLSLEKQKEYSPFAREWEEATSKLKRRHYKLRH